MIIGLIIVGILLIDVGLKGTERSLGQQLTNDLMGQQGFIGWVAAFGAIGALGYIPVLEKPSRYFIALLLIVIVLRNGGAFQNFKQALQDAASQGPAQAKVAPTTASDNSGGGASSGGGSGGGGGGAGDALKAVGTIASIVGLF
jgi:hypothetical protein